MKVNFKTFNTLPNKKDYFWQIIIIPTFSILRSSDKYDRYTAINFEWLFWSFNVVISDI
jgi:hypothetical protein